MDEGATAMNEDERLEAQKRKRTEKIFEDMPFTAPVRIEKEFVVDDSDEGFKQLAFKSKFIATSIFRKKGELPIAVLLYCTRHPTRIVDPGGVFMVSCKGADTMEEMDAQKDALAYQALPLFVKFGDAQAAVFISEIWISRPKEGRQVHTRASEDPDREEALYVTIQTKKRTRSYFGMIKRYPPKGATIEWEDIPEEMKMEGRFAHLLDPVELPPEIEEMLKQVFEDVRKERAEGTS
jgi:hypothetical protein